MDYFFKREEEENDRLLFPVTGKDNQGLNQFEQV